MAKLELGEKLVASNKKAFHDYHVERKIEAGIVLVGSEVKSLRQGKVQLVDSFASIERGEVFLWKAQIAEYTQGGPYFNHVPTRTRKLLLKRREIAQLRIDLEASGYTLVPLRVYFKKGMAKVELGLARGKTKGDKRASEKARDTSRELDRARRRSRDDD